MRPTLIISPIAFVFILLLNGCAVSHTVADIEQDVELTSAEVRQALDSATFPELDYPAEAKELGVEGRVIARYKVNKSGKAERVRILKGIGYGCDEAVIDWIHAGQFQPLINAEGQPQEYWLTIPVVFKLT